MNESAYRFTVGMFVLLALVILGFLIFVNSEGFQNKYTIYIKPGSAPGVTEGTPVRKNGILIGRVALVQTEDDHVIIGVHINSDERVYANETLSIGADGFLGDAVIEILPLPKDRRGELAVDDAVLTRVAVKRNPMEIVDVALNLEGEITRTLEAVREAGDAVNDAGQGINGLATTVQSALEDENSDFKILIADVQRMSQKAQVALDNFNRIFENVNNFVGDPELKGKIRDAVDALPEVFEEIQLTITDTRETINSYREVSERAGTNLENLEPFTASLKDNGPEILEKVNTSMANVEEMIDKIGTFADTLGEAAESIAQSEGTIGKLLNDSELYDTALATAGGAKETVDDAKETMERIKQLSTKLEPLVNDLRVFADSLARDPGQLGVRGALNRRTPGTGYKGTAGRERGSFLR